MTTLVTGAGPDLAGCIVLGRHDIAEHDVDPTPATPLISGVHRTLDEGVRRTIDEFARLPKDDRLDTRELG